MTTPITPVSRPAVRKFSQRGSAFAKSYDGLTTLAATLQDIVARIAITRPIVTTTGFSNRRVSWTGSQIAEPYTSTVPEVVMIETSAMNDIVVGSPMTWPQTCCRWPLPNRVKSDMFSDSVAQNAIMPISDGAKIFQKSASQPSFDGCDRIGPRPPALTRIAIINARNATVTSGAAQFSNRRNPSIPRQISTICSAQKNAKLSHIVHGWPPTEEAPFQPEPASSPTIT